jgi:O-antigen ligase
MASLNLEWSGGLIDYDKTLTGNLIVTNRIDPQTNLKTDPRAAAGENPSNGSGLSNSLPLSNRSLRTPGPPALPPFYVNPLIQGFFLLFLFFIPFEYLDIGIPITPSKLFGYILLVSTVLQPSIWYQRPPTPFWWFFSYYGLVIAHGALLEMDFVEDFLAQLFTVIQLLTLFWICCKLFRHEDILRRGFFALGVACTLVAMLQIAGVGVTVEKSWNQTERLSTFGVNTNEQAKMFCFGLLLLLGMSYGWSQSMIRPRWLVWPLFALLALAVMQTGSRGALVALFPTVLILLFGAGDAAYRRRHWLRNLFMCGMGLIVLAGFSLATEASRLRLQMTLYQGHTTNRETLVTLSLGMWSEKPIFGWGPVHNKMELERRAPVGRGDTHNLFLWVLLESGLVGFVPFCIGLALCAKRSWEARRGPHGFLPFALVVLLILANLSGSWHFRKHFWIILAYACVVPTTAVAQFATTRRPKTIPSPSLTGITVT